MSLLIDVHTDVKLFLDNNKELYFNERDFQMHLATYLHQTGHYEDVDVEYYVPQSELENYIWNNELRIDVLVSKGGEYLPIELKYKTKSVKKRIPRFGERLSLNVEVMKNQGAQDLGKYDFWKDVRRIEIIKKRFKTVKNGLAIFMTNDPTYLQNGRMSSNHVNFSMTEGTHNKEKHWLDKGRICSKTHPDFDVDTDYSVHWETRTIEDINIYYTILTI